MTTTAALLDVDGTLIDNNLLHVLAWLRAFRRVGHHIEAERILNGLGMGGDQLVPKILPDADEETQQRARDYQGEEYVKKKLIDQSEVLPGAADLIKALRAKGVRVALASSAKREELDRYLKLLGDSVEVDAIVTKDDVEKTKPAPDIFAVALEKLGKPEEAVVIGDTIYDIEAAGKLGLPCIALLTGGIERERLEKAGAAAIYDNAGEVAKDLERALAAKAPAPQAPSKRAAST